MFDYETAYNELCTMPNQVKQLKARIEQLEAEKKLAHKKIRELMDDIKALEGKDG